MSNLVKRLNDTLPSISTPMMEGDNLAIVLCTAFDDGREETADDNGWSIAARNGYEEVIAAIRDHYKPAADTITALRAEVERLRSAHTNLQHDIQQTLGRALGYPWFKNDQKNFPGSTEADGVCVGDHVAESLADEAADKIAALRAALSTARADALEEAARACDVIETKLTDQWRAGYKVCDYTQGASSGANDCAAAIRALIQKEDNNG